MNKNIPFVIAAMLMFGCAAPRQTAAPFDLPEGVIYESQDDIGFQSFRWGTDDNMALFMMSPHPAGLRREMVGQMASDTASQAEPELRKIEGVQNLKRTSFDVLAGEFTGKEILLTLGMSDGKTVYQCIYVLWDGTQLWQGQLTGSKEDDRTMVRTILKSKRK